MSTTPYWESGSFKVICDQCGREFRSYQLTKRWDGLMVCADDWEPRHPQDFVRGVADKIAPPYTRPEQQDSFVFSCTPVTSEGIADYGAADCARAGMDFGYRPECTMEGGVGVAGFSVAGCAVAGRPQPGT